MMYDGCVVDRTPKVKKGYIIKKKLKKGKEKVIIVERE